MKEDTRRNAPLYSAGGSTTIKCHPANQFGEDQENPSFEGRFAALIKWCREYVSECDQDEADSS